VGEPELIERFKRGDRAAFDALVTLHRDRVITLARRFLGDPHEALDVAQDVFVAAFKMLPEWKPDAQLFTWLYRTTLNLCSKRQRHQGKLRPFGDRAPEEASPEPVDRSDLAQAIGEALDELSGKQRDVFLGCHEQGETLDAVAARLGISPGTARSHLHRALTSLRDKLKNRRLM